MIIRYILIKSIDYLIKRYEDKCYSIDNKDLFQDHIIHLLQIKLDLLQKVI